MKTAVLQVADTGPLESLVVMLRAVGYECYLPSEKVKRQLRDAGCDTVLDIENLVRGMGYERPFSLPHATVEVTEKADLFVDIKAHRNYSKITTLYPTLKDKVLWYRINGGQPEHVVNDRGDHGDEVNPPCPILTPNQWYAETPGQNHFKWKYTCYPPFVRFNDYSRPRNPSAPPVCLIHNLAGWGYRDLIDNMRAMGVRCYGAGSPDGLINHSEIPELLSTAVCMVHLKSNDAPGYALYEAMAAACPVVCTSRLIWRCRMHELLRAGETCLTFDRETHDPLSQEDVDQCTRDVRVYLDALTLDHDYNQQIGNAGRARLTEVMWNVKRDLPSLQDFMQRNFP